MPVVENIGRRQCIPILYTRGTHYEVGFDVGRNFASIIHSFLQSSSALQQEYLSAYNTLVGRKNYDETLEAVKSNFPQYIDEIQGTADGAQVPFHELFLLHMDNIILRDVEIKNNSNQPYGCSSVCLNEPGQEILGHTEDALTETLNHFYLVSAHIVSDKPQGRWKVTEERFTSLCYAGHLPGYTMGFNHHGLVYSINTISAKDVRPGKIPRHIITRSLLAADNYNHVINCLKCPGVGVGDACSINLTFLNEVTERIFRNIEIGPSDKPESHLSMVESKPKSFLVHTNQFLRLQLEEENEGMLASSIGRLATFKALGAPKTVNDVRKMLGDNSNTKTPVFRSENDFVCTIATGIFDCVNRTWSLYSDNCYKNEPLLVLPLVTKK